VRVFANSIILPYSFLHKTVTTLFTHHVAVTLAVTRKELRIHKKIAYPIFAQTDVLFKRLCAHQLAP